MRRRLFGRWQLVCLVAVLVVILIFILTADIRVQSVISTVRRHLDSSVDVSTWLTDKYTSCSGNFVGYGHQFAVLRNGILVPGSEYFHIMCPEPQRPEYWFAFGKEGTHLNQWTNNLQVYHPEDEHKDIMKKDKFTIAVLRYEYANLYHTMTDWYNIFLMMKLLNLSVDSVCILMFDNHAKGHLDQTWFTLFSGITFTHQIQEPTQYTNIAWSILGYESPINYHALNSLPYIQEFHTFFLQQHGLEAKKQLDCSRISILFLWRRNYVAHSNNPSGIVSRKVKNEDELLSYFQKQYPTATVQGIQMETMDFKQQLEYITQTDVLISMHGAGLSHILFLPSHGAVIEMFPIYWPKYFGMKHFKAMARWRGLKYNSYQNLNPSNEYPSFYTYIPPISLYNEVDTVYRQMCE